MQTEHTQKNQGRRQLATDGFSHVSHGIAFEDMTLVRNELAEFLRLRGVGGEYIGNAQLIITEILSNIVKHPEKKASRVEIGAHVTDTEISLSVSDDSTPFANFDAKCEKALDVLHTGITGAETGYGLGCILALSPTACYVTKDNDPDNLNRFTAALQIAPQVKPEMRKKIFLIDDDPVSLHIHQAMLKDVYTVVSFEKAQDALKAFAGERPDVIISDLVMPDMDGIALRKALAGIENGNTTPFIFLSGRGTNESNPYISTLGVDDFLCKPVSAVRLRTVLSRVLNRSHQIRDAVESRFHQDITELLKPSLPGGFGSWRFTTRHRPVEAGGGDFILHQQTEASFMGVLIDVMGHGRQAKFFSYVYAGYLRSLFQMYAGTLDASHFLRYLSQSVAGDPLLETTIMTCQCFQFLPEGILKVASAGHPCPILARNGKAEVLDVKGPLPGLVGDSLYDMKSFQMRPGDRILFMTDGFLEAFDRRGHAAEALLSCIEDCPGGALDAYLWNKFETKSEKQRNNKDDATIIVAEYGGTP